MLITFGDERKQVGGAMGIDVASGQVRWHVTSEDALFSLPMPLTPRPSGESPWVVAGRNGQLYSVDAVTGEQLWKFQPSAEQGRAQGIYNFFTGRELSDVDDDGIRDYLIPNGGDSQKGRWESRPPGHLLVVSGRDGSILHKMKVPDGGETYCSPLIWARADGKHVVFGTGGETFPGSLWTIPLEKVEAGTLDGAQVVVGDVVGKGAVAPPSLVDLDADGIDDLVAVPFDGRLVVVSGKSLQPLWDFAPPGENETQSSPAVGDFDGDGDLDVGYVVQRGVFPAWRSSIIRVFDGGSGQLLWDHRIEDELSAASPMALDFDQDGKDELFFVHANPALFRPGNGGTSVSKLKLVHVDEGRIESIGEVEGFNAGTGWIGDAEEDGTLECYVPLTMDDGTGRLVRVDLKRSVPPRIGWGGYLGTNHDGIFASGSR
jgi:outer membrane protein assembly factor BamB